MHRHILHFECPISGLIFKQWSVCTFFAEVLYLEIADRWIKCFTESEARGKTFHPAVSNLQIQHRGKKYKPSLQLFRKQTTYFISNQIWVQTLNIDKLSIYCALKNLTKLYQNLTVCDSHRNMKSTLIHDRFFKTNHTS